MLKQVLTFLIFFLVVWSYKSYSIGFEDGPFPELVTSGRALAMGNAYISKTDDAWASFYNPAGLGTVRKPRIHLFNMHLETNKGFFDVTSQGTTSDIFTNLSNAMDAAELRTLVANDPGYPVHTRFNILPNFTMRYLSVGFMYSQRSRAYLADLNSNYEVAERQDYGPYAAANVSLFGGILKFGASVVWLHRKEFQQEYGPTDPVIITDADYNTGNMIYYTVGGRLTLPMWGLPSISAVVRNSSEDTFTHAGDGAVVPDTIPRTVDLGLSFTPQIGRKTRFHFEINYKDTGNKYQVDDSRRIVGGLEIDYLRSFFVRMGYGDAYGSFGLGVRSKRVIVDLTTYAVDATDGAYRGQEDRRFALSISSGY